MWKSLAYSNFSRIKNSVKILSQLKYIKMMPLCTKLFMCAVYTEVSSFITYSFIVVPMVRIYY